MGSEMCIRDSAGTLDTIFQRALDLVLHAGEGVNHIPALGHAQLCLLYTSDAADERSSVDLGGRRIIKKKTREKYCTRCVDYTNQYINSDHT